MKPADLVLDITIVGFMAFCWISGFIFSYFFDIQIALKIIKNSSVLVVTITLLIIYSLGILFDYINAAIFSIFKSKSEKDLYKNFSIVKVLSQNDSLYPFITEYYGRLRILRSIIISIPLITWSSCCLIFFNHSGLKISLNSIIAFIIICGVFLFILSIVSYCKRNHDYRKYIEDLKHIYLQK